MPDAPVGVSGDAARVRSMDVDRAAFERDGYVVIRQVLSAGEVDQLRSTLLDRFKRARRLKLPGDTSIRLVQVFSRYPDLQWVLFHPRVVAAWRGVVGASPVVILPEISAQRGAYAGWHRDTQMQERAGETFHHEPDYLMATAVLYLQDASDQYGGGLEVVPGSHRAARPWETPGTSVATVQGSDLPRPVEAVVRGLRLRGLRKAARDRVMALAGRAEPLPQPSLPGSIRVDSKAGDMVVFDCRLVHRGAPRSVPRVPREREKLGLFIGIGRDNEFPRRYAEFLRTRADYAWLEEQHPAALMSRAEAEGLSLLT